MWDNKMKEYEQRAGELLEAMRQVRAGARANPSPDPGPGALTAPQPASLALNPQPSGTCSTCVDDQLFVGGAQPRAGIVASCFDLERSVLG